MEKKSSPTADSRQGSKPATLIETADRLHSASIRVLRRVRAADRESGLSPARLSALSVVVYGGPLSLGALARAEQVRPPTMTLIVRGLEADGLVRRKGDSSVRRVTHLAATAKGRQALEQARKRRLRLLESVLDGMGPNDLKACDRAAGALLRALSISEPSSSGRIAGG